MPAANQSQIVLGANALEITREPVANNVTEYIPYTHIVNVTPVKIQQKALVAPDEQYGWKYRFDQIIVVELGLTDGRLLKFDLQEITNQPGWTFNQAGQQQCVSDIETQIP